MHEVWIALIGGAAAFAHCLGMCGPFALHLAGGASPRANLSRQAAWHAGKITTYVFLGALAGYLGGLIVAPPDRWKWTQDALAYLAGAAMILAGLSMLGLLPVFRRGAKSADGRTGESGLLSGLMGRLFVSPTLAAALALGLATGFLPCPVVLGFLALAVQSHSVGSGMAVMAAMGVGTTWSLLLAGVTGQMLRPRLRRWAPAVGGAVVILLGVTTALRGTEVFHRLLGCPQTTQIPAQTPSSQPHCPCCSPSATDR